MKTIDELLTIARRALYGPRTGEDKGLDGKTILEAILELGDKRAKLEKIEDFIRTENNRVTHEHWHCNTRPCVKCKVLNIVEGKEG